MGVVKSKGMVPMNVVCWRIVFVYQFHLQASYKKETTCSPKNGIEGDVRTKPPRALGASQAVCVRKPPAVVIQRGWFRKPPMLFQVLAT